MKGLKVLRVPLSNFLAQAEKSETEALVHFGDQRSGHREMYKGASMRLISLMELRSYLEHNRRNDLAGIIEFMMKANRQLSELERKVTKVDSHRNEVAKSMTDLAVAIEVIDGAELWLGSSESGPLIASAKARMSPFFSLWDRMEEFCQRKEDGELRHLARQFELAIAGLGLQEGKSDPEKLLRLGTSVAL